MLKTSLLITGDASVARKEVSDLADKVGGLGTSAAAAAPKLDQLDKAQQEATASAREFNKAAQAAATAQTVAAAAVNKGADAVVAGHTRMGASGAIMQHVVRSTTDSFVAGLPVSMIFGEQIGRIGEAAALSGGALGSVGTFLAGPWGIAVTSAVSIAGIFAAKLFETKDATDAAQDAFKGYEAFLADLGNFIDKTTGKQNALNAAIDRGAIASRRSAATAASQASVDAGRQAFAAVQAAGASAGRTSFREGATGRQGDPRLDQALAGANGNVNKLRDSIAALAASDRSFKPLLDQVDDLASKANYANQNSRKLRGEITELNIAQSGGTVATIAGAKAAAERAAQTDAVSRAQQHLQDVEAQGEAIGQMVYGPAKVAAIAKWQAAETAALKAVDDAQEASHKRRGVRARKPADTTAFGVGIGNDIAALTAQFTDAPTYVEKARAAVARLDKDIAELQKKKPPNFQTLIDQATAAKGVIEANIGKPFDDFMKSQGQQLEILKLQAQGLADEAEALRTVFTLQKQLGPLDQAHRDGILASVEAIRAEQRELEIRNELNEKYLTAIGSIRNAVEDATQAFVRGDLGQFIKTPGKLLDAFKMLQGQQLFDKLFSGVFRDLQDQISGTSPVKDAAKRMGAAVDDVATRSKDAAAAFASFKPPTDAATSALGSFTAALNAATAVAKGEPSAVTAEPGNDSSPTASNVDPETGDIVVTGKRPSSGDFATGGTVGALTFPTDLRIAAALNTAPKQLSTEQLFANAIGKLSTSLVGVFTNPQAASLIGKNIGKYAGQGLEGAATGTAVAGVAKAVGIKLNSTGSQIGGALGQVAFGPIGGLVGSIAGGIIGNLFGSVKYGGASITSKGVQGTVGNSDAGKSAGTAAGKSILSALGDIAAQLGGTATGDFGTITVGAYKDKFRVNDHGTNLKSNNDVLQYNTLEEAQAFALSAAVARNAIQGITEPVRKALLSNFNDTASALKEALKVGDLQTLIGGTQASLKKIFATEESNAKERLRLAQTYGVSIVATEKANADSMSKLVASTLKSQVGSLQSLIDDMTSGSLFEGNALDKIAALNTAIAKAKSDVDAGVEGAADTLTKLYQDRLTASKDAYGTTGAYAADRIATLDDARSTIARANAQILAAQAKSDPALATTNAHLDENNDQNGQIITALKDNTALLSQIASGNKRDGFDLSATASY